MPAWRDSARAAPGQRPIFASALVGSTPSESAAAMPRLDRRSLHDAGVSSSSRGELLSTMRIAHHDATCSPRRERARARSPTSAGEGFVRRDATAGNCSPQTSSRAYRASLTIRRGEDCRRSETDCRAHEHRPSESGRRATAGQSVSSCAGACGRAAQIVSAGARHTRHTPALLYTGALAQVSRRCDLAHACTMRARTARAQTCDHGACDCADNEEPRVLH